MRIKQHYPNQDIMTQMTGLDHGFPQLTRERDIVVVMDKKIGRLYKAILEGKNVGHDWWQGCPTILFLLYPWLIIRICLRRNIMAIETSKLSW
jgi:hypothetical protein